MNSTIVADRRRDLPSDEVLRAFGFDLPSGHRWVRQHRTAVAVPDGPEEPENDHLELEELLELEGVLLTVVDPTKGRGKGPLTCYAHRVCRQWRWEHERVSDDPDLVREVLSQHPEALVGLVPTGDLLVVDVDSRAALRALLAATGMRLEEHLVVRSPRGWHLYVRCPEDLPEGALVSVAGVDLRYGRASVGSFVLAPAQQPQDGRVYSILHGSWGECEPAPDALLRHLGWDPLGMAESAHPPCASECQVMALTGGSLDAAVSAFLQRCEALAQTYQADAEAGAGRERGEQRSESARLMACWRVAQWCGLSPQQAVDTVLAYRPELAVRITAGRRSPAWALADAERVYRRPHLRDSAPRARQVYDGSEGAQAIRNRVRRNSKLPQVWDHIVGVCYARQRTERIGLGVEEVAEAMGASRQAAALWLDQLQTLGLLEMSAAHVFRFSPAQREHNRVREWTVRGVTLAQQVLEAVVLELPVPAVWEEAQRAA